MQNVVGWLGWALCLAGLAFIAAYLVLTYNGFAASINFGDSSKFEFNLVPVWQIGLIVAGLGAMVLLISRLWRRKASLPKS
jgi:hypothetical protein